MSGFLGDLLTNLLSFVTLYLSVGMSYMPMMHQIKGDLRKQFGRIFILLSVIVIIGSIFASVSGISSNFIILPAYILLFPFYTSTLNADFFECLFVYTYVLSLCIYPFHYTLLMDALTNAQGSYLNFPLWLEGVRQLLLFAIACVFYLMRKQIANFAENLGQIPVKKFFWMLPLFFIVSLILLTPISYNTLYTGRILPLYPFVITALLFSENIIIWLFSQLTQEMQNKEKLEREKQTAAFQSERYESLRNHIEQASHIRHDFRQQLRIISTLTENRKYEDLSKFVTEYIQSISGNEWDSFCENGAVDAIVGYYHAMAKDKGIVCDWWIDLPKELPLSESVFCPMLGNLIENAIDGCENVADTEKVIHLSVRMPGSSMVAIVIENPYQGTLRTGNKGHLLSTKHEGEAIGLRSVATIVETYHGTMQIDSSDQIFRLSILLHLQSSS